MAEQITTEAGKDRLFYDGECGLCHRAVRFVIHHDRTGERFRFAPIGGDTFTRLLGRQTREALPDSIVILTTEGEVYDRWRAVRHVLKRLGGGWRTLGVLGGIVPGFLGDFLYDLVARVRHRFFEKPSDTCPVMGPHLRERFDP